MKWNEIFEGWRNKMFPPSHLRKLIEDVAGLRMDVCRNCEYNSRNNEESSPLRPDEHCTECGCTLSAKVRCLSCKCPLPSPKWKEVVSREEEEEIKRRTNGKEIQNSESSSGNVDEGDVPAVG